MKFLYKNYIIIEIDSENNKVSFSLTLKATAQSAHSSEFLKNLKVCYQELETAITGQVITISEKYSVTKLYINKRIDDSVLKSIKTWMESKKVEGGRYAVLFKPHENDRIALEEAFGKEIFLSKEIFPSKEKETAKWQKTQKKIENNLSYCQNQLEASDILVINLCLRGAVQSFIITTENSVENEKIIALAEPSISKLKSIFDHNNSNADLTETVLRELINIQSIAEQHHLENSLSGYLNFTSSPYADAVKTCLDTLRNDELDNITDTIDRIKNDLEKPRNTEDMQKLPENQKLVEVKKLIESHLRNYRKQSYFHASERDVAINAIRTSLLTDNIDHILQVLRNQRNNTAEHHFSGCVSFFGTRSALVDQLDLALDELEERGFKFNDKDIVLPSKYQEI